jgi:Fe-S cluster biogenesis protein NfuA
MPAFDHCMTITERVQRSLDTVRPYLQADGGDVELVRVTEDGFVMVKLTGSCISCPMSRMTLRAGVERRLLSDIPEIKRVEQVLC